MELNLSDFSLAEIVEIRNRCNNYLHGYLDGYTYICKVRSYGRNWMEFIGNEHTLQELCYQYFGEDGIVDVYSTNPNLSHIENYGDVMYINSQSDYDKWSYHNHLTKKVNNVEKELEDWDNRDSLPFMERPVFAPIYSREDLEDMKKELADYDMSFIPPRPY